MSSQAQQAILKLYEGQSIAKALHALQVATEYAEQRKLNLRIKLVNLTIG